MRITFYIYGKSGIVRDTNKKKNMYMKTLDNS